MPHPLADRLRGPLVGRLTIRPAVDADEPFLYRVFASTREPEWPLVDWAEGQHAALLTMQFRAQCSSYAGAFAGSGYEVIELDGRPVGRVFVHRGAEEIRVVDIGLLAEARGRGIGGAILTAVRAEAAESGRPVRLCVEPFNRAVRLYERLGFIRVGTAGIHVEMEWPVTTSGGPDSPWR
jgi:ribosomal protein S18 acetylase RimI-like enzyme